MPDTLTALRRRWPAVYLCAVGAMFVLWAVASPPSSVPDEPHHMVKAASIWQGQLSGPTLPLDPENVDPSITAQLLRTPESYAAMPAATCYAYNPDVPATCIPDITDSNRVVGSLSAAGPYPPAFYALVGWPSRLVRAEIGIYVMRFTSALLCLALVGVALQSLRPRVGDALALAAVTAALTPEVGFLAGSVNPNGLEILGGLALWSGLAAAVAHRLAGEPIPRPTTVSALMGGAALSLTRSLGPLFTVAVVLAVIVGSGPGVLRLRRDRALVRLTSAIVALVVLGAAWVIRSGHLSSVPGRASTPGRPLIVQLTERIDDWTQEMVAVFGWLDTGPVLVSVWAWLAMIGGVMAVVWVSGRSWRATFALALVIVTAVTPVILQYPGAAEQGIAWQGRYGLALAVGIPVMAVLALSSRPAAGIDSGRLATFVVGLAVIGHIAAFATAMRRYAVGLNGPLRFWAADGAWSPPLGNATILILFVLATLAMATAGVAVARLSPSSRTGPTA